MTCLDPKYRIVIEFQNIVYVLNELEIQQPKLRVLERLTDRNDYDINDTQSDIIEGLIQTDEIVLNESASQQKGSNQMLENNQNKNVNQTKVEIEPRHHSLKSQMHML